ncbi:MAG: dTMP kinase [Verrucomicrobia bacterium]|nr:dTMP kinase [Verrucomicrobiota bacterium]
MNRTLPGGFLLAVEGIDGAGKSVQAEAVLRVLQERGLDCVLTREPTNGPWGRLLRESAKSGRLTPEKELEAFIEDRQQHVREVIRPGLAAGKVVITDRYYFSTVAYQGARGFKPAELLRKNEAIAIEPHLLVIIDLPPEIGLARVGHRDGVANEFETLAQLNRSREIFLAVKKPYLLCLDGCARPDDLRDQILFAFARTALNRLAEAGQLSPRDRLNASLAIHGSDALTD